MNCTTCTAAVTVDNNAGTASYNAEYYVLGQASKFVKPGAVRIDSNTFGSGNLEDVAFRNPDGSNALVVLNADTSNSHTFNVSENGQSFTYTLPARAVATFTWPQVPSGGGGGRHRPHEVVRGREHQQRPVRRCRRLGTTDGTALQQWPAAAAARKTRNGSSTRPATATTRWSTATPRPRPGT